MDEAIEMLKSADINATHDGRQRLNERRYSVRSICWLGFPDQTERNA
jgi:hypothetical protein